MQFSQFASVLAILAAEPTHAKLRVSPDSHTSSIVSDEGARDLKGKNRKQKKAMKEAKEQQRSEHNSRMGSSSTLTVPFVPASELTCGSGLVPIKLTTGFQNPDHATTMATITQNSTISWDLKDVNVATTGVETSGTESFIQGKWFGAFTETKDTKFCIPPGCYMFAINWSSKGFTGTAFYSISYDGGLASNHNYPTAVSESSGSSTGIPIGSCTV